MAENAASHTKPSNWEFVDEEPGTAPVGLALSLTYRLPVPGGWLYRTSVTNLGEGVPDSIAMVFVREP